ncbi:arylsulfatase [Solimonas fluminis]|uniref:Arylsulfatase n=1 Tax=Solimonas fluminis TaxID=2086571 RepID=A0A2S5TH32_9GAMM|nr:arylsulfatase [Solimonas fluminis]PPE74275.1 arylsulfatase [Solimonas fluminis]
MNKTSCLGLAALLAATLLPAVAAAQEGTGAGKRPNFVLLLIDDAAYSDLGAYGGEARTPNIDRLAAQGAVFTQYHSSPLCSPSRAMLLTGVDNHRTGFATIPETLPVEQQGRPGYRMRFEPGVETVATRLKAAGYRSYMTGKWHLGHGPGELPDALGFDRSFVLDASGADNWEQKPYMPYYTSADWFEDGKPATLPKDFYSSEFLVDQMIRYLEKDRARREPFLAYIAFQAVHIPVQAPREFTANYDGVYDGGWGQMREARWRRAQERGLIPQGAPLAPVHEKLRSWESLDAEERALYARSMQVHAGMLEAMDHHIGRLVDYLKAQGQFENTVFLITSDNGPEPSNPVAQAGFRTWMSRNGYTHELGNLGEKGSMCFIGPEWANATASPGNLFKFHSSEGGMRVPLIAAGPGIAPGRRLVGTSFVTDVTPTIYDYAGIDRARWNGPVPMSGRSLKPALSGAVPRVYAADEPVGMEVGGNAALFKGDYKLTKISLPWGDAKWRLYNLATDPGEVQDLSEKEPERYRAMLADYAAYEQEAGVLRLPDDFNPHKQVKINAIKKQLHHYRFVLGGAAIVLASLLLMWLRRRILRAGA